MGARKFTRCGFNGCRKKALKDGLCGAHTHQEPTNVYPIDGVMKVTELEAARFAAMDAEARNNLQAMKILELEIEKADHAIQDAAMKHRLEQERRRAQYVALKEAVEVKKSNYLAFVADLGKKYGLDPEKMAIDPDTRVLRDLSDGNKS